MHATMEYGIIHNLRDLEGHAIEVTTVNGLTFSGKRWGIYQDVLMFFTEAGEDLICGCTNKVSIVPAHIVTFRRLPSGLDP
jgi:hypothetical protein